MLFHIKQTCFYKAIVCCLSLIVMQVYGANPGLDQQAKIKTNPVQSLAFYPETQQFFLSFMNGGAENKGYINVFSLKNSKKQHLFISNINYPKGIAIQGDILFIVEKNAVESVNLKTKEHQKVMIDKADLMDISVSRDGVDVYVTDAINNNIYYIDWSKKKVTVWLHDAQLDHPNGIDILPNGDLLVASWGLFFDKKTWKTSELGRLMRLSLSSKKVVWRSDPMANFSGATAYQGAVLVSAFYQGKLWQFNSANNTVTPLPVNNQSGLAKAVFAEDSFWLLNIYHQMITQYSKQSLLPEN